MPKMSTKKRLSIYKKEKTLFTLSYFKQPSLYHECYCGGKNNAF